MIIAELPPIQSKVLIQVEYVLKPLFRRLLNPYVVDANVKVTLYITDGHLGNVFFFDSEPSYVSGLPTSWEDDEQRVAATLGVAIEALAGRIQTRIGHDWTGSIVLKSDFSGGQATILSEANESRKVR
jgi:hypothetical protein